MDRDRMLVVEGEIKRWQIVVNIHAEYVAAATHELEKAQRALETWQGRLPKVQREVQP